MIKRDKHIDVRIELLYMYHISMDMERQLFCKQNCNIKCITEAVE